MAERYKVTVGLQQAPGSEDEEEVGAAKADVERGGVGNGDVGERERVDATSRTGRVVSWGRYYKGVTKVLQRCHKGVSMPRTELEELSPG